MPSAEMIPAALYLRMSTAHQQYSLENQSLKVRQYADSHGFYIVKTYSDPGKSGLTIKKRPGMLELLHDVATSEVAFRAILVYDVSRWGRFQDVDESAYYEFLCKAAGVPVHFCAESFENDGTPPSMIMKVLKRTMAGEYSRELGVKVLAGQKRLASLGFKQGGIAGYGLRRIQVTGSGERKQWLDGGQRKNILIDRVILAPGPTNEVDTVREIYRLLIAEGRAIYWIARELNKRGVPYLAGRRWHHSSVNRVLTHQKYAGCCVFNRSSQKIGGGRTRHTDQSEWVTVPGAYEAIVDSATFEQAQRILRARTIAKSNHELLNGLRKLLAEKGKLTSAIIDRCPDTPSVNTYARRFGNLLKVYELIGYRPPAPDLACIKNRAQTLLMREELIARIMKMFPEEVTMIRWSRRWRARFRLRCGLVFSVQVARVQPTSKYWDRWRITPIAPEKRNITLLARLKRTNDAFHDFYVLPDLGCNTNFDIREVDPWLNRGKRLFDLYQLPDLVREIQRAKESPEVRNLPGIVKWVRSNASRFL